MQDVRNNSPSFGAKIVFMDRGDCFSIRQKLHLKSIAKHIGTSEDRFYVGTRKYKYISAIDYKTRFQCKDMQILSSVNGVNHDYRCMHRDVQDEIEKETSRNFYDLPKKERWGRFNKNIYNNIKEFLETYNESASQMSSRVGGETRRETHKLFKREISEFSRLKPYPKIGFKKWLKSLLFKDETLVANIEDYKPIRRPEPIKSNMEQDASSNQHASNSNSNQQVSDSEDIVTIGEAIYDVFVQPAKDIISDIFKVEP